MPKKTSQTTTIKKSKAPQSPTTTGRKRVAPKKVTTKTKAVKVLEPLVYADNETSFWVADGNILNSLVALHEVLKVMDAATFAHHVTANKNDFSEWVQDVLGDASCAQALRTAKTPKKAAAVVAASLKFYSY